MDGGLPSRPRVWVEATCVNKWPTGSERWIARNQADGDDIQDANKGGAGEFTLLRRFSEYLEEYGAHRDAVVPGAPNGSRGVAVDSSASLLRFERSVESDKPLFG